MKRTRDPADPELARGANDDEEDEAYRLKDFAKAAQEFLARVPADSPYRFGRYKVFLAAFPDLSSKHFRSLLVRAHQAGYLQLSRADLVPAMDRRMVEKSEIRGGPGGISEWHFVTTEGMPSRDKARRRKRS